MTALEAWRICEFFFELVGIFVIGCFLMLVVCCLWRDFREKHWPTQAHASMFRDYKKPTHRASMRLVR